jgi:hypothetical protein
MISGTCSLRVICQAQSDIPLTWRFNFALWPMLYVMGVRCGFPSALRAGKSRLPPGEHAALAMRGQQAKKADGEHIFARFSIYPNLRC